MSRPQRIPEIDDGEEEAFPGRDSSGGAALLLKVGWVVLPWALIAANVFFGGNGVSVIAHSAIERTEGTARTLTSLAMFAASFVLIWVQVYFFEMFKDANARLRARTILRERVAADPRYEETLNPKQRAIMDETYMGIVKGVILIGVLWLLDQWIVVMGYTFWQTGNLEDARHLVPLSPVGADYWSGLILAVVINLAAEPLLVFKAKGSKRK